MAEILNKPDLSNFITLSDIDSEKLTWKVYSTINDLPDAASNHGMIAHVHSEGAVYFSHGGTWNKLRNQNSTISYSSLTDKPSIPEKGDDDSTTSTEKYWSSSKISGEILGLISDGSKKTNKTYSSTKTDTRYFANWSDKVTSLTKIPTAYKQAGDRSGLISVSVGTGYVDKGGLFDGVLTKVTGTTAQKNASWDLNSIGFYFTDNGKRAVNEFTVWMREQFVPENITGPPEFVQDDSLSEIVLKIYGNTHPNASVSEEGWKDLNSDCSVTNRTFWMSQAVACKSYYRKAWDATNSVMATDLVQGWVFRAVSNMDNYASYRLEVQGIQGSVGLKCKQIYQITLDYKNMYELDYIEPITGGHQPPPQG